jgi:hypothetical protein
MKPPLADNPKEVSSEEKCVPADVGVNLNVNVNVNANVSTTTATSRTLSM